MMLNLKNRQKGPGHACEDRRYEDGSSRLSKGIIRAGKGKQSFGEKIDPPQTPARLSACDIAPVVR
ncbi:hypothetical protein NBRC116593_26820 [Sulfitobacter pacificus]